MADETAALVKALNSTAAYNAAKYGGGAPTSKLGGLLDILLPAYQAAFPKAPAANLAMGARQAWNLNQYNKAVAGAQQAELSRQLQRQATTDTNNAAIYNQRTGSNVSGPFDIGLANASAGDIRKDNSLPWMQNVLSTGRIDPSQMVSGAEYDPKIIEMAISRANDANDAETTLQALPSWMQTSQQQPQSTNGLDYSFQQPQASQGLQAGVSQTQGVTPSQAFSVGIPNISNLLTGRSNEQSNARGLASIAETGRHNKVSETESQRSHRANEAIGQTNAKAHMISANKPSGGGSGNPFTIPNAAQNYVQGQINAIDKELGTLGYVGNNGEIKAVQSNSAPGWLGLGGHQQTAKEQRAQALINMRNSLQGQILPGGGSPFGGNSSTKLQNAGQNAVKGTRGTYVIPD